MVVAAIVMVAVAVGVVHGEVAGVLLQGSCLVAEEPGQGQELECYARWA